MNKFKNILIATIERYKPKKVIIQNLADSCNGVKNQSNRIEADCGLIDSIFTATEEIANLIKDVSEYTFVEYYNVYGNHSEIHKDKIFNIEEENLERLITWGLQSIFNCDNVVIHGAENTIVYDLYGEKVFLQHGHNNLSIDKITNKCKRLPRLTYQGHYHTYKVTTLGFTESIQVGAMLGSDSYAESKGYLSPATQLINIISEDWNVIHIPVYLNEV
jgi:hypothetical protein